MEASSGTRIDSSDTLPSTHVTAERKWDSGRVGNKHGQNKCAFSRCTTDEKTDGETDRQTYDRVRDFFFYLMYDDVVRVIPLVLLLASQSQELKLVLEI